jgi:tetratricopeptide (TPR) repeat protein
MSHLRLTASYCLLLLFWGTPALAIPPAATPGPTATNRASLPAGIEAQCNSVQRILSEECAGPLGRELCGDSGALAELARKGRDALKLIVDTRKLLNKEPVSEDASTEHVQEQLDRLEQFGEVFACLGELEDSEEARKKLIGACGGLAAYLDDPNPAVVEAAKLWQGVAYRRAGRVDRALQVLRPVLTKPADAETGFWLRVERCRALADRGDTAAGIALCLRLEKRVVDWFDEDQKEQRIAAQNTLRQLRANLWKRWSQQLKTAGKIKDADEAATEARTLAESIIRIQEEQRCLKLTHALPSPADIATSSAPSP